MKLPEIPIEFVFGIIALVGGIARNLSAFSNGTPFSIGIFLASSISSAFSGFIFGLIGLSMNLPTPILFAMAGTGGFFGDQTMKIVLDYIQNRVK